jgi:CDP-glucose 4,6-dehydratase
VLEPLCGYLLLAERLHADAAAFGDAWNFGPADTDTRPVGWVVSRIVGQWGVQTEWCQASGDLPHESDAIMVDASRARLQLGWTQRLPLETALHWTVDWYRRQEAGEAALALTDEQLARYCEMAAA